MLSTKRRRNESANFFSITESASQNESFMPPNRRTNLRGSRLEKLVQEDANSDSSECEEETSNPGIPGPSKELTRHFAELTQNSADLFIKSGDKRRGAALQGTKVKAELCIEFLEPPKMNMFIVL